MPIHRLLPLIALGLNLLLPGSALAPDRKSRRNLPFAYLAAGLHRELGSLLEIGALGRTLTQGLVAPVPVLHASPHSPKLPVR